MRLLQLSQRGQLTLTKDLVSNIPSYAILSHTWGDDDDEVTFDDLERGLGKSKVGYAKLQFCGNQARKDKIDYFWVDTCCINKANHAELSEAITSMFRWYRDAVKCYVYLSDVPTITRNDNGDTEQAWQSAFRISRWFTRGWTLQELLAPRSVQFFSREEMLLGDKETLVELIHEITDIPIAALQGTPLAGFQVDERLRWAVKRDTKKKEDKAYCLLGIFNVFIPLIYGEEDNALTRLKEEICWKSEGDDMKSLNCILYLWRNEGQLYTLCHSVISLGSNVPGTNLGQQCSRMTHIKAAVTGIAVPVDTLSNKIDKRSGKKVTASPLPSSTVPFRRDVDFVDRRASQDGKTLLEQIEEQCGVPAARVALVGIGGAGKSQLAIEYCHRLRERSPATWVFWIHASNIDRIEQGYREIAERVKIPGREDPKVNILELVARWLQDESQGAWLLVLDNLDSVSVLSTSSEATPIPQSSGRGSQLQHSLLSHLPQSANGAILVTTRTSSVAATIVEPRDVIVVNPMINTEAVTLLKKKLDVSTDDKDLEELARILEYMPLAIVQAAAYIRQKRARYSVRQYIEAFQKNEKQKTSLLNHEAGQFRQDREAKNSIIITWQISFDDIRESWPSSADLLSLMSCFDRQGIPEDVLKVQLKEEVRDLAELENHSVMDDEKDENEDIEADSVSEISGDDVFEEAMERLQSYSFVSIGEDGRTFEMHGLVQLVTRKWLEMHGEDEKWKSQFSWKLNAVFPNGGYENWALCEILFPHAKSAERQQPKEDRSVRDWAQILRKAGWYANAKGDYVEAERMCERSARALRRLLGDNDVETLYSLGQLATIYWSQGRWTEAEKMEVQVMETRKRVLGEEHPSTLTSMANLATTYRNQGRWTEAEKIEVQVMETRKRVLGRASLDADQYGQPGYDIPESRTMDGGGEDRGAGSGDESEGA